MFFFCFFFQAGSPDKFLFGKREEIIKEVVDGLVNTIEVYWESAGNPVNKLEISLVLKDVLDAVVEANLIKTPEMLEILNKKKNDEEKKEKEKEDKENAEKQLLEDAIESDSEEETSDEEDEETINTAKALAEEEEMKLTPKEMQEIEWVVDDLMQAILNTDHIIHWKKEKKEKNKEKEEKEKKEINQNHNDPNDEYDEYKLYSNKSLNEQYMLLATGHGPYHQLSRNRMKSRIRHQQLFNYKRAFDRLNDNRKNMLKLKKLYLDLPGSCDPLAVVVDAMMNAVAWCDLSVVENGLALLDNEKGPFNMHARKTRKAKRAELEALEITLLNGESVLKKLEKNEQIVEISKLEV